MKRQKKGTYSCIPLFERQLLGIGPVPRGPTPEALARSWGLRTLTSHDLEEDGSGGCRISQNQS